MKTMTIDDIMNPGHTERGRAAEGMVACDHGLAIIDELLARLEAARRAPKVQPALGAALLLNHEEAAERAEKFLSMAERGLAAGHTVPSIARLGQRASKYGQLAGELSEGFRVRISSLVEKLKAASR